MKDLIAGFTSNLKEAVEIGEKAKIKNIEALVQNVLITGLGGSGIGGTIISSLVEEDLKVPLLINKDYFLPGWVGKNTLLIVCSYSGNTEETLHALSMAEEKGAHIIAVTSEVSCLKELWNKVMITLKFPADTRPEPLLASPFPNCFTCCRVQD